MRKLFAALAFAGMASIGQAAVVQLNCSPNPIVINGQSGADVETCDISGLAGATINSVEFFLLFDILTNADSGATADFAFSLNGTTLFDGTATTTFRPVSTAFTVNPGDPLDFLLPLFSAGGTLQIDDSFTGNQFVQGGLFSKTLTVDYTPSQIPEPASMALLGVGLLGLGIVARRRGYKK